MHNCKFCNKEIKNKGSLVAHQQCCKNNPDRTQHFRSPNAGRHKGCIGRKEPHSAEWHEMWRNKYPDEKVFIENSSYVRKCLRGRILKFKLIEYKCALCGLGPEWYDKPMPLILDHINGINNDNRLENLRFICSNCDSTLPTYKSRNRLRMRV